MPPLLLLSMTSTASITTRRRRRRMTMSLLPLLFVTLLVAACCISSVSSYTAVPLPQIILKFRSSSPDTNVKYLLLDTMRQSDAFFEDYFAAYYNATNSDNFAFHHVTVTTKTYGITSTTVKDLYRAAVELNGFVYYRLAGGETQSKIKDLVFYALNDNNRGLFVRDFLIKANNSFLQGITNMDVTIDGVFDGSTAPPLPAADNSTSSANAIAQAQQQQQQQDKEEAKKSITLTSVLVVAFCILLLVAIFVIRRRRQNSRRVKQLTRQYGPTHTNPAYFGRRNGEAVIMAKALSSPLALRADRDEELVPHQGGRGLFAFNITRGSSSHTTVTHATTTPTATSPFRDNVDGLPSSNKGSFSFSKLQNEDSTSSSQFSSVAMDVEAWKHFSSSPQLATKTDVSKKSTSPTATAVTSGSTKKYASPTWTSHNRFHFDIDEEEDDDRVEEWKVIT